MLSAWGEGGAPLPFLPGAFPHCGKVGWARGALECLTPPLPAEALSCFYNSRANMTCVWSPAADLGASSCNVIAKSKLRCVCT